jgi:hypothetical protein
MSKRKSDQMDAFRRKKFSLGSGFRGKRNFGPLSQRIAIGPK